MDFLLTYYSVESFHFQNPDNLTISADGHVTFIDDMGKDICDDWSLATMCAANANEDAAEGDQNKIEVR